MKIEVEIDDAVYNRIQELLGDIDIAKMMGAMWQVILVLWATHPEEFIAVFSGQGSPEQRQQVDEYLMRQVAKLRDTQ